MNSLTNKFKDYFSETTSYLCECNENRIRIGDSCTGVYLNLYFNSLFKEFPALFNDIGKLEECLKDNWDIDKLFHSASQRILFSEDNDDLVIWGNPHSSFKDRWIQGFYKDNYSEFLIELDNEYLEENGTSSDELMTNFEIGNVKVKISQPSLTFKLIFNQLNPYIVESGWQYYITLSLKGLPKTEVNNYLQQALFLLDKYNSNCFVFGGTKFVPNNPNACDIIDTPLRKFPVSKHIDPLCLYNEAINATKETCFNYFYRTIEYFFPVNQKTELLREINNFIENNQSKNENELISRLIDLCSQDEEINLKYLLNNKDIQDKIIWLTDSSLDNNNYENAINKFAHQLYKYRNRVVHSKESTRRVPNVLENITKNIIEISDWNETIQAVSLICIENFCYENKFTP